MVGIYYSHTQKKTSLYSLKINDMSGFLFFLLLTVLMSFLMNWVFMRYLHTPDVKETCCLPKKAATAPKSSLDEQVQMDTFLNEM